MSSKINPSLQKKSAARMVAVQTLYQDSITGEPETADMHAKKLQIRLANNRDEQKLVVGAAIEPNYTLFEKLLTGVTERAGDIDAKLDAHLNASWKRERMSPLLLALLRCAVFELLYYKEISQKIVIDEYTRLARRFFADDEVNFVHAILSTIAKAHG